MKEQEKIPEKNNEREISNLPDKKIQNYGNKTLTELGKRIDLNIDHFNKELENIKTQSKIDNSLSETKKYPRSNAQQTK